jgi:hypothetical protein
LLQRAAGVFLAAGVLHDAPFDEVAPHHVLEPREDGEVFRVQPRGERIGALPFIGEKREEAVVPTAVHVVVVRARHIAALRRTQEAASAPRQAAVLRHGDVEADDDELRGYPCDRPEPETEHAGASEIAVPLRIRHDGSDLSFISTVATFGTPLDVTLAELSIESFFPADAQTADALRDGRPRSEGLL